jgi:ribonuclease HI
MMKCKAITKKGKRCSIDADPGSEFCHVHNPAGKYQRQLRSEIPKPSPENKAKKKGWRVPKPTQAERPVDPKAILWADGYSEPNPGIGCYGWIAKDGGKEIASDKGLIGENVTNNEAEFQALIEALTWANNRGLMHVIVHMDSNLVVNQVRGDWKCSSVNLKPLLEKAWNLAERVRAFIVWIPREENTEADELSNQAYKEYMNTN